MKINKRDFDENNYDTKCNAANYDISMKWNQIKIFMCILLFTHTLSMIMQIVNAGYSINVKSLESKWRAQTWDTLLSISVPVEVGLHEDGQSIS